MSEQSSRPLRGRLMLLLLAAIFMAPVVLAYLFYFVWPTMQPTSTTNKGHLVVPAKPVEVTRLRDERGDLLQDPFSEKWTLLQMGSSNCREICQRMIWNSRQVRTSLGRRMPRVQRLFVATDRDATEDLQRWLAREHPDMQVAFTDYGSAAEFINFFSAGGPAADASDYIYLIDPLGNWLMFYTPEDDPAGMLKDLKKLLKLSQIG